MEAGLFQSVSGGDEYLPGLILGRMPQQLQVRTSDDDWTGLASAEQRRKLQNRLNQRIYRRRRRANPSGKGVKSAAGSIAGSKHQEQPRSRCIPSPARPETIPPVEESSPETASQGSDQIGLNTVAAGPNSICGLGPIAVQELVAQYAVLAQQDYLLGSPRVDQLLTLVQFNVFRALISNTFAMGFSMEWLEEYAISPWVSNPKIPNEVVCPESLRPSTLQRTIVHHPWIDLFPVPKMRDNLLLAEDTYDEYALCNELVDFCDVTHDKTGLIVWREPWDPSGWEISESFLSKWGWVVEGCDELLRSTNYWRMTRGENILFF